MLATVCDTAVVTLGRAGCLAMRGGALVREPAVAGVVCVDSTGAGDLFAAGFMFGMFNSLSLTSCVGVGCLAGAAVIKARRAGGCCVWGAALRALVLPSWPLQGYGAEVTPDAWAWARSKLPALTLTRDEPASQPPRTDAADAPASQTDSSY